MRKIFITCLIILATCMAHAQSCGLHEMGIDTITIQTNASKNCKSCVNRFKENVPFFKGVKDYTFDTATAKLTVTYDTKKTTADQIRKQISDLGYDADKVKANEAARAKLPACCRKESCGK